MTRICNLWCQGIASPAINHSSSWWSVTQEASDMCTSTMQPQWRPHVLIVAQKAFTLSLGFQAAIKLWREAAHFTKMIGNIASLTSNVAPSNRYIWSAAAAALSCYWVLTHGVFVDYVALSLAIHRSELYQFSAYGRLSFTKIVNWWELWSKLVPCHPVAGSVGFSSTGI
jgi:hypothetical protein